MLKKSMNEEEYDKQCEQLKENMILYIDRVLRQNAWRVKYSKVQHLMILEVYNLANRLLWDFKNGWYFRLDDTNLNEISERMLFFKYIIPLDDDIKTFINVVILYYFKYFKNSSFSTIYNNIFDDMCNFDDKMRFG